MRVKVLNPVQSVTGRGVMPSVKLALDHVNEHSDILRNYRLHMWWNDTEVIPYSFSQRQFVKLSLVQCSATRPLV